MRNKRAPRKTDGDGPAGNAIALGRFTPLEKTLSSSSSTPTTTEKKTTIRQPERIADLLTASPSLENTPSSYQEKGGNQEIKKKMAAQRSPPWSQLSILVRSRYGRWWRDQPNQFNAGRSDPTWKRRELLSRPQPSFRMLTSAYVFCSFHTAIGIIIGCLVGYRVLYWTFNSMR